MPLSWNEIRSRAVEFSKRWEHETSEDAEAKAFWTEFLNVFGIDRKRVAIETAAQAVLDARAQFPQSSLADLYDPLTMPPVLVKAHQTLDRAVDASYRKTAFANDAQRVGFLFERYQHPTSLLPAETTIQTE